MLYPQDNRCRDVIDLGGFWEMKVDREDAGEDQDWGNGFESEGPIGVPGSWNEQLAEMGMMFYLGALWYQTEFHTPTNAEKRTFVLRFGSADHHAKVWVNGIWVGEHAGGFLPFEFDVTEVLHSEKSNRLVVRVDNRLSHDTIPQGITEEDFVEFKRQRFQTFPTTAFDFLTYGGLQRPVRLSSLHPFHLSKIVVETRIRGKAGEVFFRAKTNRERKSTKAVVILLDGNEEKARQEIVIAGLKVEGRFRIPDCAFWSPESPHLYAMRFELFEDDKFVDEYSLDVGVREIEVDKETLRLNGEPIFLKGFGKHEDFPVLGKGLSHPLIVKDFQLMRWIGANSFRTSHYPYAEEVMQMADRLGFLVIDEVPAVSLNLRYSTSKTAEAHKRALRELIARDRNHACVIAWSIANEPGIWGEEEAVSEKARAYWAEIYDYTRALDSSRPVTLPTCSKWEDRDLGYTFSDFISINRYWGWYELPGEIERAGSRLRAEMEHLHEKYRKPILVSEFGPDTIPGEHATFDQLFTEEYQSRLIQTYFDVIASLPFAVGEHIWNFADFKTAQHHYRVILNRKGIFDRQRNPKSAAFTVRKHWQAGGSIHGMDEQ